MPGSATLGNNLIDRLVGVTDRMSTLQGRFGLRQARVYIERVTWSGGKRSVGTGTLASTEITPAPSVQAPNNQAALHDEPTPAGRVEEGDVELVGVSLTYTEAELTGGSIVAGVEFRYKVVDGLGQGIPDRYFAPSGPPFADREKTIGWRVRLHRVEPLVAVP